jgi:hypothetical protein
MVCTAARSSERKRMLKFIQLRSKIEIFAEIISKYPDARDMYGSWEIDTFNFTHRARIGWAPSSR